MPNGVASFRLGVGIAVIAVLGACSPRIDEQVIEQTEQAVRQGLAAQGTVKQVELTKQDDNTLSGYAVVQTAQGAEARFTCSATRRGGSGSMFDWTCNPPNAQAASQTAEPAPTRSLRPDDSLETRLRTLLAGRWDLNSACQNPLELTADGTFRGPQGGTGQWTIEGDRVVLSGPGGVDGWRVTQADGNSFVALFDDGEQERMIRC